MLTKEQRESIFRLLRRLGGFEENPHLDFALLTGPGGRLEGRADLLQAAQWIRGTEPHFEDDYLDAARRWDTLPSGGVPPAAARALTELRDVVIGSVSPAQWLERHEPELGTRMEDE